MIACRHLALRRASETVRRQACIALVAPRPRSDEIKIRSRGAMRVRGLQNNHNNNALLDSPPAHKEGGGAPKGACRPLSAPHWQTSPPAVRGRGSGLYRKPARLPALHCGTRQGCSLLAQLQATFPGTGAERGYPASVASPASSSRTGRCAGRVVPEAARVRVANPPAGTAPAPPFRHAFRKGVPR